MKKLTAEKAEWIISQLKKADDLSQCDSYHLQALEIALPVLGRQAGWISCSERMPEDYEDVIASDGYESKFAYWDAADEYWLWPGDSLSEKPTHWQPLPAPPQPQPSTNPQIDNDIWIEWRGGECPVPDNTKVQVKFWDGYAPVVDEPHGLRWSMIEEMSDIIAYRVIENDGREG